MKQRNKPMLILDLDGVVFCAKCELDSIDLERHKLGEFIQLKGGLKNIHFDVAIINPEKLRYLLENTCTYYGGIVFMTAGFWDEISVKQNLINYLDLSPDTASTLRQAAFLNAKIAHGFFPDLPLFKIPEITKDIWLEHFIQEYPLLKSRNFVVLDDNPRQIEAFSGLKQVKAILASTRIGQTPCAFYKLTLNTLKAFTKERARLQYKPYSFNKLINKLCFFTQSKEERPRIAHKTTGAFHVR